MNAEKGGILLRIEKVLALTLVLDFLLHNQMVCPLSIQISEPLMCISQIKPLEGGTWKSPRDSGLPSSLRSPDPGRVCSQHDIGRHRREGEIEKG